MPSQPRALRRPALSTTALPDLVDCDPGHDLARFAGDLDPLDEFVEGAEVIPLAEVGWRCQDAHAARRAGGWHCSGWSPVEPHPERSHSSGHPAFYVGHGVDGFALNDYDLGPGEATFLYGECRGDAGDACLVWDVEVHTDWTTRCSPVMR